MEDKTKRADYCIDTQSGHLEFTILNFPNLII